MHIDVTCKGCGKHYSIAERYAGRRGKCKVCGGAIVVPSPVRPRTQEYEDLILVPTEVHETRIPRRIAEPVAAAASAPPVSILAYAGPIGPRTGAHASANFSDPFEGNKFRNLYVPATLILLTTAFRFGFEMWRSSDPAGAIGQASIAVAIQLAVEIPLMLVVCLLAVKLLDAAFGPLGPAILKLCAIALAPGALEAAVFLIGAYALQNGGMPDIHDLLAIRVIGWLLSLGLYFWLFIYLFSLEFVQAFRVVVFIWVLRTLGTWILLDIMLAR